MDDAAHMPFARYPTPNRPLLGLTILVVEDSRFACEAMRLLCLRSGARIRRADCLASARRHLRVYRPSAIIVDLGLPDGSGLDLIAELAAAQPRVAAILGTSGDPALEDGALRVGADGFLPKPVESLARFQQAVLACLPADLRPTGPRPMVDQRIEPDPLSLRDDMIHAAELLSDGRDGAQVAYVAQFLTGVARSARDTALEHAAEALAADRAQGRPLGSGTARVAALLQERLAVRIAI